jgi:hypothetical protein
MLLTLREPADTAVRTTERPDEMRQAIEAWGRRLEREPPST